MCERHFVFLLTMQTVSLACIGLNLWYDKSNFFSLTPFINTWGLHLTLAGRYRRRLFALMLSQELFLFLFTTTRTLLQACIRPPPLTRLHVFHHQCMILLDFDEALYKESECLLYRLVNWSPKSPSVKHLRGVNNPFRHIQVRSQDTTAMSAIELWGKAYGNA